MFLCWYFQRTSVRWVGRIRLLCRRNWRSSTYNDDNTTSPTPNALTSWPLARTHQWTDPSEPSRFANPFDPLATGPCDPLTHLAYDPFDPLTYLTYWPNVSSANQLTGVECWQWGLANADRGRRPGRLSLNRVSDLPRLHRKKLKAWPQYHCCNVVNFTYVTLNVPVSPDS